MKTAFAGYDSLNRLQSRVFGTAYGTNENMLVCAPTGAGKTDVALMAILREIKQHLTGGRLDRDQFKIIYVAPMKALAAEVCMLAHCVASPSPRPPPVTAPAYADAHTPAHARHPRKTAHRF